MNYPDFHSQGYQILQELGRNREGGRILEGRQNGLECLYYKECSNLW
jgi:hypothetical protein